MKLFNFIVSLLPKLLEKAVDKVVAVNFGQYSNQLTFSFKAVDISSIAIRQLGKLMEMELGALSLDVTFITNSYDAAVNEQLLRTYQVPIVIV
jgi:hypothetical protein